MVAPGPTTLVQQLVSASGGAARVISSQTADGTAGTRSEHAHGCTNHAGYAVAPVAAFALQFGADNDADNAGSLPVIEIVSIDDENVVVKSDTNSAAFDLLVIY